MSIDELSDDRERLAAGAGSAEELALVAAEAVAMIEHHRDELRAAMAELTALQRTVRAEIRDAIHELDRIAAGVPAAAAPTGTAPTDQSRRPPRGIRRPFRR